MYLLLMSFGAPGIHILVHAARFEMQPYPRFHMASSYRCYNVSDVRRSAQGSYLCQPALDPNRTSRLHTQGIYCTRSHTHIGPEASSTSAVQLVLRHCISAARRLIVVVGEM